MLESTRRVDTIVLDKTGTVTTGRMALVDVIAEYCIDILTQVSAATSALQSVAVGLLDEHVRHCVRDAAQGNNTAEADRMIGEATRAIERLVKA